MTETEKMRAILHELGVEYRDVNSMVTDVEHDGIKTRVYDYDDGPDYQLCVEQKWLTAEEAVRVALGIKSHEVLERRIDELREDLEFERSENGWVREFLNRMGQKCGTEDCTSLVAYVTKLEAENAKLRELVRELWDYAEQELLCDENCPYGDTCDWMEPTTVCVFRRRMRELGVEVDE